MVRSALGTSLQRRRGLPQLSSFQEHEDRTINWESDFSGDWNILWAWKQVPSDYWLASNSYVCLQEHRVYSYLDELYCQMTRNRDMCTSCLHQTYMPFNSGSTLSGWTSFSPMKASHRAKRALALSVRPLGYAQLKRNIAFAATTRSPSSLEIVG